MARVCAVCGKRPQFGSSVSHAHNVTKRCFMPNLQKIRTVDEKGRPQRKLVCTRCIRSNRIRKQVS